MIYLKRSKDIRMEGNINNHSPNETLNTTKSILDKGVTIEISASQEMCEKKKRKAILTQ